MYESNYDYENVADPAIDQDRESDSGRGEALNWFNDLSVSSGPARLADGFASFDVMEVIKSRFEGSAKLAPSPMAVLTLRVVDSEGEVADIERRVILNSKLAWQIADLMRCVGLIGEHDSRIPAGCWDRLVGRRGVCELLTHESSRGTRYSSIERFLHGDEADRALAELGRTLENGTLG